jgi:hypothetical protein
MWCKGSEKGSEKGGNSVSDTEFTYEFLKKKSRDVANAMFLDFLNDLSVLTFKIFLN